MRSLVVAASLSALSKMVDAQIKLTSSLAVGERHVCALDGDDEQVRCWGDNKEGELGLDPRIFPTPKVGNGLASKINLGADRSVIGVCAGQDFSCAILDDGKVKCWGDNKDGQLGIGATKAPVDMGDELPYAMLGEETSVKEITCGSRHVCATFANSKTKCWGLNDVGQLGLGKAAVSVGTQASQMGSELEYLDLGSSNLVNKIRLGGAHSCALLSPSNGLKCWGDNSLGQLGLGSKVSPIGNSPAHMGDALAFVNLGPNLNVIDFDLGRWHTCAIVTGLLLKCWGDNYYGQLGRFDSNGPFGISQSHLGVYMPFVDLGSGTRVVSIALGNGHSCALTDAYQVKCWGDNGYGQLGLGSVSFVVPHSSDEMGDNLSFVQVGTGFMVIGISTGGSETCAILSNQKVKCWGWNQSGQLGICSNTNVGTSLTQMGDNLQFATDCGSANTVSNSVVDNVIPESRYSMRGAAVESK